MGSRPGRVTRVPIVRYGGTRRIRGSDPLATEEPLEIRVLPPKAERPLSVAVTMRTPGNDFELAVGFLCAEGMLRGPEDLDHVRYCAGPGEPHEYNVVQVALKAGAVFLLERLQRHFFASSSCGVCGKASIDSVEAAGLAAPRGDLVLGPELLGRLPAHLRQGQRIFEKTGGLHGCALFDPSGELRLVREDVGRHNALDKLLGRLCLDGSLPASDTVLLLSGRASFELLQKAVVAGIPAVAALGAPSSLAVSTAQRFGVTLVGFLKEDSFNVYSGDERLGTSN